MTRQEHLLTIAAEECAEVAQRCSKALRFGMEQVQADTDHGTGDADEELSNAERIMLEYSHLVAVLRMLKLDDAPEGLIEDKQAKVEKFLRFSAKQGTLTGETP